MITATAAYSSALCRPTPPVYAAELVGPKTFRFTSGDLTGASNFGTAKPYLQPLSLQYDAEPAKSRFTGPTLILAVYDIDGKVTDELAGEILDGYECTFYHSFRGLDFDTDAITRFKGIVSDVSYIDGAYRIIARSAVSAAVSQRLWDAAKTELSGDIDDSQTSMIVEDAGPLSSGVVRVGLERITWSAKSDNGNGTWTLSGLTRGWVESAAAHSSGDTVQEVFLYLGSPPGTGDPFDFLEAILTNARSKAALGLDAQWIDASGFADAKSSVGSGFLWYIESTRGANAKTLLEEEFFRPTASYPAENSLGQLRPALFDTPSSSSVVDTIRDLDAVELPRSAGRLEDKITEVIIDYNADIDDLDGTFGRQHVLENKSLTSLAGRKHSLRFSSIGLRSDQPNTEDFLDERSQSFIDRFGYAAPTLEFRALMSKELLEIGDPVFCHFANVLNPLTGSRSIDGAPYEIIGMTIDYGSHNIRFRALGYPNLVTVPDDTFTLGESHSATGFLSQTVA